MKSACVRVTTPAKVNVFLEVCGKRADGYHEVDTELLSIGLEDVIEARLVECLAGADDLQLAGGGPAWTADIPVDERNLAWRAAASVRRVARERGLAGAERRLELHLEKHIPSGAGLGGGSANAAGAHLATAELLGMDPDDTELVSSLASLGADCAFFLSARRTGRARCTGIGELVEPLSVWDGAEFCLLLVPDVHVPTPAVYRALGYESGQPREERRANGFFNRLERAACEVEPLLEEWRKLLMNLAPGRFLLSGSGASFFTLCSDLEEAKALRDGVLTRAKARDLGLRCESTVRVLRRGVERLG